MLRLRSAPLQVSDKMVFWVPNRTQEHMVDALAVRSDEGRGVAAKSSGEACSNLWSGNLRMRKLTRFEDCVPTDGRSEPGEVKHLSTQRKREQLYIPEVAASERGTAQTCMRRVRAIVRWNVRGMYRGCRAETGVSRKVTKYAYRRICWKAKPQRVIAP